PSTWLFPIPQIFRRHSRIFVYKDMAKPEAAIDVALQTDPVVWAGFDVDRSFHAHAYATTPDAAPPPELVKALGEPSFAVSPPFSEATAAEAAVSSIDLRILAVLMRQRLDFAVERLEGWIQDDLEGWGRGKRSGVSPSY